MIDASERFGWRLPLARGGWLAAALFFFVLGLRAEDQPALVPRGGAPEAVAERSPSDAPPLPAAKQSPALAAAGEKQTPTQAVCTTFRVRDQDQVWLVSTRHLGCFVGAKYEPSFQYWRYAKGVWQPATEALFLAEDSAALVTPVYVHGNRVNSTEASSFGLSVYFELVGKLDAEPPTRFVIWSWPSDQVKGPLNDIRSKAARSDYEAFYLGCFLAHMNPEVRTGLLGYSFGARIVSGAMHLTGGGAIFGAMLSPGEKPQARVAMWAAAEHNHWYQPGQFHDRAPAAAAAWFVTVNCCDPVLTRYRFIDPCGDPAAVGYAGIHGRNLLPTDVNARIEEVNVSNIVGGEHHWRPYLYSRYIQDRTREYVLWHEVCLAEAKPAAALVGAK